MAAAANRFRGDVGHDPMPQGGHVDRNVQCPVGTLQVSLQLERAGLSAGQRGTHDVYGAAGGQAAGQGCGVRSGDDLEPRVGEQPVTRQLNLLVGDLVRVCGQFEPRCYCRVLVADRITGRSQGWRRLQARIVLMEGLDAMRSTVRLRPVMAGRDRLRGRLDRGDDDPLPA